MGTFPPGGGRSGVMTWKMKLAFVLLLPVLWIAAMYVAASVMEPHRGSQPDFTPPHPYNNPALM